MAQTVIVQLSDPHLVAPGRMLMGCIDTAALLAQAVATVGRLRPAPAAVLLSGDLVDAGRADEYAHLRALLAPLRCPLLPMPGNHDATPALRAAFADLPWLQPDAADPALAPYVLYARDVGTLRVVALDTVVTGAPHGALCDARLAWLDRALAAAPAQPTILAMHHAPFATGIAHMDAMGLRHGAGALAAVLRRHPQVEVVACGHLHRAIQCRFAGTLAMTAPSTAHQIAFDLDADAPAAWRAEPPGFVVHVWQGGALVSHVVASGEHGPQRLFDD
jgi:3',5'-cyclic AMP phosphodiesterase CpdA